MNIPNTPSTIFPCVILQKSNPSTIVVLSFDMSTRRCDGRKRMAWMGWCIYEYMLQFGRFTLRTGIELSYRDKRWSRVLLLLEGRNRVLIGCWLSA